MPGKTVGYITFLPLSAKLHNLPTVIISGKTLHKCVCQSLALGLACISRCTYSNTSLHYVCMGMCSICVYDWFTANIKERKTVARR